MLPRWLEDKRISERNLGHIVDMCHGVIVRLEAIGKPGRARYWHRIGKFGVGGLMIFAALLLTIPVPPIIPFTNTLPAIAILLLAFGQLRGDGMLIFGGKIAATAAALYFVILANSFVFAGTWLAESIGRI